MSGERFESFPIDFQKEILSCLIQDKRFLKESLGLIKPEYFENQLHLIACKSIQTIYLQTKQVPSRVSLLHSLSQELSKTTKVKDKDQHEKLILAPVSKLLDRLFRKLKNPSSQDYIKQETLKFCRVQDMKRSLLEAFEMLEKDKDPDKARDTISKKFRSLDTLQHGGVDFFQSITELPSQLKRDKGRCSTTGFPKLDKMMDGGMDPGTETVFLAPAKFGKSMVLVNVGFANLMRGKTVVHFTLEISEKKLMKRYASRISRVANIQKLPKTTINRVRKFYQQFKGRLFVKGYPTKTATVENLKSYLYYLQNRYGMKPDVIIVDYGDILRSYSYNDKSGDNERFVQTDVYEGLRAMAQEFDCALVTASQTKRSAATKTIIRMEEVAEAYAKVQVADHIISLCGTEEERKVKRLRLFFAGSREAETERSVKIRFNWKVAFMGEVNDDDLKKDKDNLEIPSSDKPPQLEGNPSSDQESTDLSRFRRRVKLFGNGEKIHA